MDGNEILVLERPLREGAHVALMHRDDLLAKFLPLVGQAHADRAAVMERALLHDVARLDHLLHVVGDVRAKIAAAQGQLADRHLEIADVEQYHCLHVVDVMDALAVELELHHLQELAVQALDQRDHVEISGVHGAPKFWRSSTRMLQVYWLMDRKQNAFWRKPRNR